MELGGVAQLRESARDARGLPWLSGLGLDLRLGARMLRKSWALTLVGGLAMAVTIGLGASIFAIYSALSTIDPASRRRRPHRRHPAVRCGNDGKPDDGACRLHATGARQCDRSTDLSAMRRGERSVMTPDDAPRPVAVAEMTASGFRVARVAPLFGRSLVEDDERTAPISWP